MVIPKKIRKNKGLKEGSKVRVISPKLGIMIVPIQNEVKINETTKKQILTERFY